MPLLLMAILAGFAVLLSAMGTYGVITHLVAGRTSAIGMRMALGARPGAVRVDPVIALRRRWIR